MLQQDPRAARQAAGSKENPSLWMVVLWIREGKYRKCREEVELKQGTAVLISVENRRDSRGLLGSGGPQGLISGHPKRSTAHWGPTTPCVSPVWFGVPSFGCSCPSSCFSLESLRVDAEHFWKIVPLWSVPFLQLSGMQTNKGKAEGKQDFHNTDPVYNWLLSMTRFTWSGIISEANA